MIRVIARNEIFPSLLQRGDRGVSVIASVSPAKGGEAKQSLSKDLTDAA